MKTKEFLWPNEAPQNCPFPQSSYSGILFTGNYANYKNADTFYPSWASDGNLYCPWTDGFIDEDECHSFLRDGVTQTGQIKIIGDDPFQLELINLGHMDDSPEPYEGRYPSGCLVYNGVWYHGSYCLTNRTDSDCGNVGWTELGPFVGFRTSEDWNHYTTDWKDGYWKPCPHTGSEPLFGENSNIAQVKIGAPHFVDFGQNLQHSPDGKAYLVAHGSSRPEAWNSWIQGDEIYLVRVRPERLNDFSAYEFYAGKSSDGTDIWSDDFKDIQPLIKWEDNLGCVTMTYNAPLEKYFMCITRGIKMNQYNTMILESDSMTGPWNLVQYMKDFGPEAYFVNIPSKFISDDGEKAVLWYSANFTYKDNPCKEGEARKIAPEGSSYSLVVHEIQLVK